MPEFTGNYSEVVTRGITSLSSQTNIKQMASGSKARSLIEVHAKEVENLATLQEANLKKAFLPTTFGQSLDYFAATVGIARYTSRNAEALAEDRVFRYSVFGGGNFGSINGGVGFTIPAGTRLVAVATVHQEAADMYADIDSAETIYDRSIHYEITVDAFAGASNTEMFVSARSLTPGSLGNLSSPKMVASQNFNGYADYLNRSLVIENMKPVLNGTDEESNASLRYRISKEITSAEKANAVSITNAAKSVPGVADVVIIPWEDGVGRFNVYIKSISAFISDKTISDVQSAIDGVMAEGTIGYARKPYEIGIEINSTISFKSSYELAIKSEIRDAASLRLLRYLNSMALGQSLMLSDLVNYLKQNEDRISSVGYDATTFFDRVFVWYPARLADGGRRRERLIVDQLTIPGHARITAETSISDPIRLT